MNIYETNHFVLEAHPRPEIDRLEGGHMKISPKTPVEDRSHLSPQQAIELMRLTTVAGIALKAAMKEIGIDIGRINYQDNGNWNPTLHIHIYGRAKDAVMQKYGDPLSPGHKPDYVPLDTEDRTRIHAEMERLLREERFSDTAWNLV
jgi:diadenosine tetraphosphate (Ap4A) HIT family hydrolase